MLNRRMANIIAGIKPAQATARPKLFPCNDVEYHDRTGTCAERSRSTEKTAEPFLYDCVYTFN
jgi:hypothetical protein